MNHEHVEVNGPNGNCMGRCIHGHEMCILHPHLHHQPYDRAKYEAEQRAEIEHGVAVMAAEAGMPDPGVAHVVPDNHGDGGWDADVFPDPNFAPSRLHEGVKQDARWAVDGMVVPTEQAQDILGRLVPEWRDLFLLKNSKYKSVDNALGPAGVFPDVYRKMCILRDRVWEQEKQALRVDEDDDTRRVVLDTIGHLFLMLHMMDKETGRA